MNGDQLAEVRILGLHARDVEYSITGQHSSSTSRYWGTSLIRYRGTSLILPDQIKLICWVCGTVHTRQLLGGNEPGLTKSVSPNRLRQRYKGTSLIRNCFLPRPYSRPMPRALWWS